MKRAFVASPSDLSRLSSPILSKLSGEPIVCSSLDEITELQRAEAVFFVVSELSMCSTAYEELVRAAFMVMRDQQRRFLLPLDDVTLPIGFQLLQSLREGLPE